MKRVVRSAGDGRKVLTASRPGSGAPTRPGWLPFASMGGLLVAVMAVVLVFGNRSSRIQAAEQEPNAEVIVPADVSASTKAIRARLIESVESTGEELDAYDFLTLIKFASVSTEVFSHPVESRGQFKKVLKGLEGSDPVGGSDYVAALKSAADAAERSRAKSVFVLVVGDGERDGLLEHDKTIKEAYRTQAQRLVSNPRVKEVRFFGLSTDLHLKVREDVRAAFSGPYESKLRLLDLVEDPWN